MLVIMVRNKCAFTGSCKSSLDLHRELLLHTLHLTHRADPSRGPEQEGCGIHASPGQCSEDCGSYLEGQHCAGQVGSLDFRHIGGQHFIAVGTLRVQSVTLPWASSPSPASSLLCLSLEGEHRKSQL